MTWALSVRLALLFCLGIGLARSSEGARPLPHEAYIWQRQWTGALRDSIARSADLVEGWRVLAAQTDRSGRLMWIPVDWEALAASDRPVTAVIRIEGQVARLDTPLLVRESKALIRGLSRDGAVVAGLEIDHDCATAHLPAYADFLADLRAELPGLPLSITALPAWLSSTALDRLLAQADAAILQVHAVEAPARGLFDPSLAARWAGEFGRRTEKPFRVALPAYEVRVTYSETGALAGVEAERPLLSGAQEGDALRARPEDVARLIAVLERDPPPTLAGFVWFRLPTAADRRAWTPETWRAVIRKGDLAPALSVEHRRTADPAVQDLVLANAGSIDAPMPETIPIPAGCRLSDGVNEYAQPAPVGGRTLVRRRPGTVPARGERIVGWVNCARSWSSDDPA